MKHWNRKHISSFRYNKINNKKNVVRTRATQGYSMNVHMKIGGARPIVRIASGGKYGRKMQYHECSRWFCAIAMLA